MITEQIIKQNIGNFIRLGGHGILDGLKQTPAKCQYYKLLEVCPTHINLKAFRKQIGYVLNHHNWNQEYEIISPKQYKQIKSQY